jgi:hypothetical protein
MEYALDILRHSESVLAKKIKGLKDGKPKWAAAEQMAELRFAIQVLERYTDIDAQAIAFGTYLLTHDSPVGSTMDQRYDDFLINGTRRVD